ncbi:hypothetical protein [Shewanella sp.]|uniref:hypothetical protein n=1 Tax=Shewanella sp. TaxID=50422 RepID=UPI004047D851
MEEQIAFLKSSLIANTPISQPISYIKIYPDALDRSEVKLYAYPTIKQFYLITYTFAPKVLMQYQYEKHMQITLLRRFLQPHYGNEYYSCIEEHKIKKIGGQVVHRYHMHLMINSTYEKLFELCVQDVRILTGVNTRNLSPAIDIKPVKLTEIDIARTYDYIILDKADHPYFKDFVFNIDRTKIKSLR